MVTNTAQNSPRTLNIIMIVAQTCIILLLPTLKAESIDFGFLLPTVNLYFIYADTFPINNELDTPSRALILINRENEIIYLWYDEIDLFGCSCL